MSNEVPRRLVKVVDNASVAPEDLPRPRAADLGLKIRPVG